MFIKRQQFHMAEGLDKLKIPDNKKTAPLLNNILSYPSHESVIKSFLDAHNIEYVYNAKDIVESYTLNFYIPSARVAIEVCDLYSYRHELLKNINFHVRKLNMCLKADISLVTIFSDQIEHTPDIVIKRLESKLKLLPRLAHARELAITHDYSKTQIATFLKDNHIQGSKLGTYNIAALHNGTVYAAMTFGSLRRSLGQKTVVPDSYEMYRFASLGNIPGIASKMFKYFVKTANPASVISYADRCWGEGDLYKKLGFELVSVSGPNYWYTNDYVNKIHRFGFTKHTLVQQGYDSSLTENEIMTQRGYSRIYDCGSNKFSWHR